MPENFKAGLDAKSLEAFNVAAEKPFSEQACFFLNAFWAEFGDQAEWIYSIAWDCIKYVDMANKGVKYVHKYEEAAELKDFDVGIHLFERLAKISTQPNHSDFYAFRDWFKENKDYKDKYAKSFPEMKTSIVRKKELRDKVDVNFNGKVSFIEYLLFQYDASPKDLMDRSMNQNEHELVRKAREALAEVNKRINAFEAEKQKQTEASKLPGVKGLRAKNLLAQIDDSPLWDALNKALITAEAAVRIAIKKVGGGGGGGDGSGGSGRTEGVVWWMKRDLAEKKKKYGRRKK